MDYMSNLTMSSGSDTLSGSVGCGGGGGGGGGRQCRVRTVRLVRPCTGTLPPPGLTCRHGPGLGFSVRGGREHGTGFFVSHVELGSEAHRQGLKVGDQIIRVNGFTVDDAVHKEVLQLISNHTHLTLKVRSVGMIPVKDKCTDPLSWQIIPDYVPIMSESPPLEDKHHDVRINIAVAQRMKLGCGICKGPEWKPGIFVQFTKDGGIARDAGLRPGDQILFCNDVDFTDISFNEAVNIMKTSKQLDLIVRKGAGSELFPGESSGYNSSASSVTGDQSPSWSDSKRLSIVKEESLELEDRLSYLDFQRYKPKSWEKITYEWDENPRHFKPTIINLSENGTTIKNNGTAEECQTAISEETGTKLADICLVSHQQETKTVVVEVHRSDVENNKCEEQLKKSPSTASFSSLASRSSTTSSSLTNAITMELQRRSQKNKDDTKKNNMDEEIQKRKILKGVDSEKKHQHDKLMDEFRKAHRKMFNSSQTDSSSDTTQELSKDDTNTEEMNKDRQSGPHNSQRPNERKYTTTANEETKDNTLPVASSVGSFYPPSSQPQSTSGTNVIPPPPPPMPLLETNTNAKQKSTKPRAPPVPQKHFQQTLPPPCPTPDYDTLSLSSNISNSTFSRQSSLSKSTPNGFNSNAHVTNINGNISPTLSSKDGVDMESLESYKLNNPTTLKPRPPNIYFNKPKPNSSQTSTSSANSSQNSTLRKTRPVSVTIGEYPSGLSKRQPVKFDFLNNINNVEYENVDYSEAQPITSRLASELAQTLSRSNLKKRTESTENLLNDVSTIKQADGTVTIAVNDRTSNYLSNLHKPLIKSQSTDVNISRNVENRNRVTIKISDDSKNENPSSILKNGNGNNCSSQHKPLVHQKSITFGEITTVINDRPMHVS